MNTYESPTVLKIGRACDLILGEKPCWLLIDSELVPMSLEWPWDIDEVDS